MFCAALIAVTTYSSVAATDPPASATQAGFDLLWWVTTASLVLSPIILIGLATQGAWKLPPSPRLPAWRMPLEVGFLVFATSILLGGIGNWLAAGFSNGDGAEFDSLRTIGMGTLGAYIGSSIPLVAMGILWTQLPRPVGSERPLPRAAAIIFGAIALAIGLPLVLAVSSLGNHFQQMIQGTEAVSIAHDTLKLLITTPKNLWWWIVALGALLAAPIVEETLYRGILQQSLRRLGAGRWWAILLTTGLFALMHVPVLSSEAMIGSLTALFAAGFLFGWIREQTGRLDAPIVAHVLFNAFNLVLALLIDG